MRRTMFVFLLLQLSALVFTHSSGSRSSSGSTGDSGSDSGSDDEDGGSSEGDVTPRFHGTRNSGTRGNGNTRRGTTETVSGSMFRIVRHSDPGFTATNRKIVVFGIPIYAYADVEDIKLIHAANLMAQYLDNNEDGEVDNPRLLRTLKRNKAALYLWKREDQQGTIQAQDLGADETVPEWHTNGHSGRFDAALEEVWHVVTHSGYSNAYPRVFGERPGTSLTKAMDKARGGRFQKIPGQYPRGSWYTYDDQTCDYECMATEYFYWAMSSILGAQAKRASEIGHEWKPNTRAKVQGTDPAIYRLLTDPKYHFPTKLPDGTYGR